MSNEKQERKQHEEQDGANKTPAKVKVGVNADSDSGPQVNIKAKNGGEEQDVDLTINGKKIFGQEEEGEAKEDISNHKHGRTIESGADETPVSNEPEDSAGEKVIHKGGFDASGTNDDAETTAKFSKEESKEKKGNEARDRELRNIQQSLLEAELKVLKLEGEIQRLNEQYTKKVTEKAVEAQKVVDKRLAELQDEFASKAAETKKYALASGAAKLAELLQNFEMVLSTSQKAGEAVKNYSQGFVMVFEMMVKTLNELGITPIEVKPGDEFDHDTMEIFEGVDSMDFKHNQVVEVLKKGYRLHDKVIAHAIVKVAN